MTELDKARPLVMSALELIGFLRCCVNSGEHLSEEDNGRIDKWIEQYLDDTSARTAELTAYLECCKAVDAEQVTDTGTSEDTAYNIALEDAVRAIRSLPRFAELNK